MTQEAEKDTKSECRFTLYVRFSRRVPNTINIGELVMDFTEFIINL